MSDCHSRWPLEPDSAARAAWLDAAARLVEAHLEACGSASASGLVGEEGWARAAALSRPIPEEPGDDSLEAALETIGAAAELSLNTIGPGYMAYVPGGGLYATALAAFVANALNRFTGMAEAAPGFARLEADTWRWLAAGIGYGAGCAGLFTTGGSMANFGAIVAARHAAFGDTGDLRQATLYTSSQAHRCVAKAARLAGIPAAGVRELPADAQLRLDPAAVAAAVARDRAAGKRPFLLVASAGTTNTGAIDPIEVLADLAAAEGLWLHVDGAYGGAFALCTEGRARLRGIERAASVALDPHKGLFLPYGLGCLLVRDGAALRAAHADRGDYLQDLGASDPFVVPSPADFGPELSREFRGLKLWLPLMIHGAAAFRQALSEKLRLARRFRRALEPLPLEVVVEPELSTVAFRLPRAAGEPLATWNTRNRALLDAVNSRQRVFLSSTTLPVEDGAAFTLRVCVVSFRTHAEHVDACVADLIAALD